MHLTSRTTSGTRKQPEFFTKLSVLSTCCSSPPGHGVGLLICTLAHFLTCLLVVQWLFDTFCFILKFAACFHFIKLSHMLSPKTYIEATTNKGFVIYCFGVFLRMIKGSCCCRTLSQSSPLVAPANHKSNRLLHIAALSNEHLLLWQLEVAVINQWCNAFKYNRNERFSNHKS